MYSMVRSFWTDLSAIHRFRSVADWTKWMELRLLASRWSRYLRQNAAIASVGFRGDPTSFSLRSGTSDFLVLREIFLLGGYDALQSLSLGSQPTIVDLGANIGAFLMLARRFWPSGRFVGIEPDASNFELLKRNVSALRDRGQIELVRECIGGQSGRTNLDRSKGEWAIRMTQVSTDGEVPVEDMKSLLDRFGIERVSLLKCDIEGAERDVFANCSEWIHRVENLVIEVHGDYTLSALLADLGAAGSRLRCLNPQNRRPTYVFSS